MFNNTKDLEERISNLEKELAEVKMEHKIMMKIFLTDDYEPRYAYKPKHAKKGGTYDRLSGYSKENENDYVDGYSVKK